MITLIKLCDYNFECLNHIDKYLLNNTFVLEKYSRYMKMSSYYILFSNVMIQNCSYILSYLVLNQLYPACVEMPRNVRTILIQIFQAQNLRLGVYRTSHRSLGMYRGQGTRNDHVLNLKIRLNFESGYLNYFAENSSK